MVLFAMDWLVSLANGSYTSLTASETVSLR